MTKGRPLTMDVKNDKEYFKKYYHKTNEDYKCEECGALFKLHSKRRHLMSQKHIYMSELLRNLKSSEIKEV